jgi:hypothetical protein
LGKNCVTWTASIVNPVLKEKGESPITTWTPNGLIDWILGTTSPDRLEFLGNVIIRKNVFSKSPALSPHAGIYSNKPSGRPPASRESLGGESPEELLRRGYRGSND